MSDETPKPPLPLPTPLPPITVPPVAGGGSAPPSGAEILAKAERDREQLLSTALDLMHHETRRSVTIGKLAGALSRAQGKITGAVRDSKNPFFKSKYASLSAVWDACRPALSENEIAVIQTIRILGRVVTVTTLLAHSSDEWIEETLTLVAASDSPQAVFGASTYGRRYGLSALVGVAPEDDDGESASHELPKGVKWDKGTSSLQTPPDADAPVLVSNLPNGPTPAPSLVAPSAKSLDGALSAPPRPPLPRTIAAPLPAAPTSLGSTVPPPPGKPPARMPGT